MAEMVKFSSTILGIDKLTEDLYQYHLSFPEGFVWDTAAHFHIGLPGFDVGETPNKSLVHHFSIMSKPEAGEIVVITRVPLENPSHFKSTIKTLGVGDSVTLFKFAHILERAANKETVFITQGVGLAPAIPLFREFAASPLEGEDMFWIHTSRVGETVFVDEAEALLGKDHVMRVESRSALSELLSDFVPKHYGTDFSARFILVGSPSFIRSQIAALRALGVADDDILLDKAAKKRANFFDDPEDFSVKDAVSVVKL